MNTPKEVLSVASYINKQKKDNKDIIAPKQYQKLLTMVSEDVILSLGCRLVEGIQVYVELPDEFITKKLVKQTLEEVTNI